MRNPLAFAAGVMALLLARAVQPAEAEVAAAQATAQAALDQRVEKFLASHRGAWRDMNVPEVDGRTLRDLIVRKGFRHALEIGTSTGHSAIWIAWGLSRTGGRLITIDIDPERHREAVANFQAAGLSAYIDARLADAHVLVPQLEGPFDFVFSDADKDWYTKYFVAVWPKVSPGGCFTAHNVGMRWDDGIGEFLDHLQTVQDGRTTIDRQSRAGLSITCRTAR